MNPAIIGIIVFACTFAGALFGIRLRTTLPEHHLNNESRDTIKVGVGLVATMTALVLGLVTASAKSSLDAVQTAVRHSAMDILTLDRLLARYGPETGEIRGALQRTVAVRIGMIWPQSSSQLRQLDPSGAAVSEGERLVDRILRLTPHDDSQRLLQSRALELADTLLKTRWMISGGEGTSVPRPFLVILLFWLMITFASFGLLAPRNATVLAVLFVCALSVGSAMFFILEMDQPFDGLLKVSAGPLRYALAHLNQ
jgi:hypothetical protein